MINNTNFIDTSMIIKEVSTFQKVMRKMIIPFSVLMIINIIFAIIYLVFCNKPEDWNGMDDEKDTLQVKLFKRIYFSMTTLSTVGYGDISPKSIKARTLVMIQFIFVLFEILSTFI